MKILHIIRSANPEGGGPIEGIQQRARALQKDGHIVEIVSLDAPGAEYIRQSPIPIHAMGPGLGGYGYSRRLKPWLAAHCRDYDACIVNGLWQYHGLAAHGVLRRLGVPYHVFTHGMLDPWFKRQYPLKHLKKWLYWPWGEYRVLRDAATVLFTCEEERRLARHSFCLYKCNERVVNYGTAGRVGDAARQREMFLEKYPHLRGKRCLLFLSRIHPKKGVDLLIEAFARVDIGEDFHLVIAGPDQVGWQTELQRQAQRLGVAGRITWTGMLGGDMKWGAYLNAEAFVLPSHQENFGIVVAEALSCGLPVLISDKVNIWREIVEDDAGLVAADDLAGCADMLQRWARLEDTDKARMRENARTCFEKRFEIGEAARSLLEVLRQR